MKRLSDYTGEDAIELWGDILGSLMKIFSDKNIAILLQSGKPKLVIVSEMLKAHTAEISEILLRIDDTPLNGLNVAVRMVELLNEIEKSEELKGFFGFAEQKTEQISSGSATENTGADEN